MSNRTLVLAAVGVALLAGASRLPALEGVEHAGRVERPVRQQLVGAGEWQSRRSGGDDHSWHIQLKRLDDDPRKNWVIGPSSH